MKNNTNRVALLVLLVALLLASTTGFAMTTTYPGNVFVGATLDDRRILDNGNCWVMNEYMQHFGKEFSTVANWSPVDVSEVVSFFPRRKPTGTGEVTVTIFTETNQNFASVTCSIAIYNPTGSGVSQSDEAVEVYYDGTFETFSLTLSTASGDTIYDNAPYVVSCTIPVLDGGGCYDWCHSEWPPEIVKVVVEENS